MGTDPYPGDGIGIHDAECTVVAANTNCDYILASFQAPKAQRWMRRIGSPKMVALFGEALDIFG